MAIILAIIKVIIPVGAVIITGGLCVSLLQDLGRGRDSKLMLQKIVYITLADAILGIIWWVLFSPPWWLQ